MDTFDGPDWDELRPELDPYLLSIPSDDDAADARDAYLPTVCIASSDPLTHDQLRDLVGSHREALRSFLERHGARGA